MQTKIKQLSNTVNSITQLARTKMPEETFATKQ